MRAGPPTLARELRVHVAVRVDNTRVHERANLIVGSAFVQQRCRECCVAIQAGSAGTRTCRSGLLRLDAPWKDNTPRRALDVLLMDTR